MMENGWMISHLTKDKSSTPTRISFKGLSSTARSMEKEFIIIIPVENIRANGFKIGSMDTELLTMLMEINLKAIGKMGKGAARESTSTRMGISMKVNGLMI